MNLFYICVYVLYWYMYYLIINVEQNTSLYCCREEMNDLLVLCLLSQAAPSFLVYFYFPAVKENLCRKCLGSACIAGCIITVTFMLFSKLLLPGDLKLMKCQYSGTQGTTQSRGCFRDTTGPWVDTLLPYNSLPPL